MAKTLTEKYDDIARAWKVTYYKDLFYERTMFENIMDKFRYKTSAGWGRTADISTSFPGIDFYHDFIVVGDKIDAGLAVSMKTTVVKDVDQWLSSTAIKDNISKLTDGLQTGIKYNGKTVIYETAQIHIYMPKDQIEAVRTSG